MISGYLLLEDVLNDDGVHEDGYTAIVEGVVDGHLPNHLHQHHMYHHQELKELPT